MVDRTGLYAKLNICHKSRKFLKKTRHVYVPRKCFFLNHQICKKKILVEILINCYGHLHLRAGLGGENT